MGRTDDVYSLMRFLDSWHIDVRNLASSCREGLEKLKPELHDSIQKGVNFVHNPPAPKK
jgi:hypothetical protein